MGSSKKVTEFQWGIFQQVCEIFSSLRRQVNIPSKKGTRTGGMAGGAYDVEGPKAPVSMLMSFSIQLIYFALHSNLLIAIEVKLHRLNIIWIDWFFHS